MAWPRTLQVLILRTGQTDWLHHHHMTVELAAREPKCHGYGETPPTSPSTQTYRQAVRQPARQSSKD